VLGSVHRSGEAPGDTNVSGLDEVLQMKTFLFGIGRLNVYVFYGVRPGDFRNLSGGMQYPPVCPPNRRIWIRIRGSANDKEILIVVKRSALDCYRRRDNQYSNDLDMDERNVPSPARVMANLVDENRHIKA
jgi:hypothetical protein